MSTPLPTTAELVLQGAPITLRDGGTIRIRQGRASDRGLLVAGFERLSDDSRYKRFLAPTPALSDAMVRHLTEVDHHDREAMIALDAASGDGIGVARYVRDPARPEAAEVAVTVIDDWQGRGVGTLLLEVISARARAEGIGTFTALMLATNAEMMDLLRQLGPVRIVDQQAGTVEVELAITTVGLTPALRRLLRIAARTGPPGPLRPT